MLSLKSRDGLLPSSVCRLGCLLNIQLRRCLLIVVECAEPGGGGCLDDLRETRLHDLLTEKACPDCVLDHSFGARLGCDESSQVCLGSDVTRSLEPDSSLARAEGCSCHAVLRPTWEEQFERPLPDPVITRCRTLLLQDCVAVNPQNVVNTTNFQRILAKLDALVHCADDICLAQELVCAEAPAGDCRGFGHAPHVANVPLRRCCA